MRLVRHLDDLPYPGLDAGSVVTIGAYDGLHLGHQKLLDRVTGYAGQHDLTSVVMSFEPTPKEFLAGSSPPARLMRFREKFESLASRGIDLFYCPRFAAPMRDIAAPDFIRRILIHGLNARYVVVGDDFQFARRREGTIELPAAHGRAMVAARRDDGRCHLGRALDLAGRRGRIGRSPGSAYRSGELVRY